MDRDGDATGAPQAGWIKTNRGVACCIAGVAVALLIYLGTSEWAFRKLRDGFHLGFFTTLSVLAMLGCAIAIMVDRHHAETDPDIARSSWRDWLVAFVAMVLCYVFFQLAWNVDFLLVTPVFLAGATWWLGVRPVRSAIIAGLVITIAVYGIFRLINIELPTNLITF